MKYKCPPFRITVDILYCYRFTKLVMTFNRMLGRNLWEIMNIRQVLRYQLYVGAEPFNKRNPLLWICKIPFGRRLIDLPFCADRKFHAPKGFFRICRKVNIIRKSLAYNSFAAMIILYYSHYSPLPVANKSALQKRGRRERWDKNNFRGTTAAAVPLHFLKAARRNGRWDK